MLGYTPVFLVHQLGVELVVGGNGFGGDDERMRR